MAPASSPAEVGAGLKAERTYVRVAPLQLKHWPVLSVELNLVQATSQLPLVLVVPSFRP